MKLHQVLMAVLMFKSLDLAIVYAATVQTEHFIALLFFTAFLWIVAWIIIWILVEAFLAGRLPGQGDGNEG